jgi:hypothetical protein
MTAATPHDPKAFGLFLEDGRCIWASGAVYRYDGTEDDPFTRVAPVDIEPGDCIFAMSEELQEDVEEVMVPPGAAAETKPSRKMLDHYRSIVSTAISFQFSAATTSASITLIRNRMTQINADFAEVSAGKLRYWITLGDDKDVPHGARDKNEFMGFCSSLGVEPNMTEVFWQVIRQVRYENQSAGRDLKAFYTELLLRPENTQIYRHVSQDEIQVLRSKALDCVFHVVAVEAPTK